MKRSPFAYGRKIDRTIFWLVFTLVIVIPITVMMYSRSRDRRPDYDDKRQLISKTTLMMMDNQASNVVLKKGEQVTVLGHVKASYYNPFMLWVETSDGCRGHIPVEAVDNRAIISPLYDSDSDELSFPESNRGDTVRIVKWLEKGNYQVKLASGDLAEIDSDDILTMFHDDEEHKINYDNDGWQSMSIDKFKSIYMTEPFEKVDTTYLPAYYLIRRSNGSAMAAFPIKVFNEGKFYTPIINYDNNGMPVEFIIPEHAETDINESILQSLPFYGSICDLPVIGSLWTDGIYITEWEAPRAESLMRLILNFILYIPVLIIIFLFPPLIIPLILFGLLRFRAFKRVSNAKMRLILKITALILTILWWFICLPEMYLIPLVIGSIIALLIFNRNVNKVLDRKHPTVRCPGCATLYSITYDRTVEEGERDRALEEKEYLENDVVTNVERWQTWTEVTTTYSDGSTSRHKENVQNHKREHGYRTYGVYNELAEYIHYTTYYICDECGHVERKYTTERKVLSRTKLRAYQEQY